MIKSDRILVTGAAGLMGSALVDHLRAEGYENVIPLQRADCDLVDTTSPERRDLPLEERFALEFDETFRPVLAEMPQAAAPAGG